MLAKLDFKQIVNILGDDPVRPHLNGKFRCTSGREVYALYEDQFAEQAPVDHKGPLAIICVAYTNEVPLTEHELDLYSQAASQDGEHGNIAVFYTVWSYTRGAGRQIVLDVASHIKRNTDVNRWVTLSPLTEMAERFHIRNGATLLERGTECQNFEYKV